MAAVLKTPPRGFVGPGCGHHRVVPHRHPIGSDDRDRCVSATLAMSAEAAAPLLASLELKLESAFVLTTRRVVVAGRSTLLVRSVIPVPDIELRATDRRRACHQLGGWVPALARQLKIDCGAIFLHTHPGGLPEFSDRDEVVHVEFRSVAASRTDADWSGSLVLAGTLARPTIGGAITSGHDTEAVDRLRIVGRHVRLIDSAKAVRDDAFDRNIRAFGEDGQRVISKLRVGVVGAGGTGSAVVEQLARLGVEDIVIVDPDVLEASNTTRVYGSTTAMVGLAKAEIAASNATAVGRRCTAWAVVGDVTQLDVARQLVDRDVIFGCTDDHAGRMAICRFPIRLLLPVIDCGVVLDSVNGVLASVIERVTRLSVGDPCLICTGRVDPTVARAEQLDPDERRRLAGEGYVPEVGGHAPAVVAYTSMTAVARCARALRHDLFDPRW